MWRSSGTCHIDGRSTCVIHVCTIALRKRRDVCDNMAPVATPCPHRPLKPLRPALPAPVTMVTPPAPRMAAQPDLGPRGKSVRWTRNQQPTYVHQMRGSHAYTASLRQGLGRGGIRGAGGQRSKLGRTWGAGGWGDTEHNREHMSGAQARQATHQTLGGTDGSCHRQDVSGQRGKCSGSRSLRCVR